MTLLTHTSTLPLHSAVATIGMFDGVHLGHQLIISTLCAQARAAGKASLVVTFDRHPQHVLRPDADPTPLIMSLRERLRLLGELGVDYVLPLPFTAELARLTAGQFMATLQQRWGVDTLVMGYNHRFGSDRMDRIDDYRRAASALAMQVVQAPEYDGAHVSSSIIRRLIGEGRVAEAAALLGRPFALEGTVVHGEHVGTGLGFPTANVGGLPPHQLLPADGAYAVQAVTEKGRFPGMAGVGTRPTVSDGLHSSIEVNLFTGRLMIYDQPIRVEFVQWLRGEKRFSSVTGLIHQLAVDREQALKILHNIDDSNTTNNTL